MTFKSGYEDSLDCCSNVEAQRRILRGLGSVKAMAIGYAGGSMEVEYKIDGSPVTEADQQISDSLRESLLRDGEGWVSEEDDGIAPSDSGQITWIVDPIDGTKEFTQGRNDWAVSVAAVRGSQPVAAGVMSPLAGQVFFDHICDSTTDCAGESTGALHKAGLAPESTILASRSEVKRGDWDIFEESLFRRSNVGSIAYKLALVSGGLASGTVSLAPKNMWDIAAGIILIKATGGAVVDLNGESIGFENHRLKINGLIAGNTNITSDLMSALKERRSADEPA